VYKLQILFTFIVDVQFSVRFGTEFELSFTVSTVNAVLYISLPFGSKQIKRT